MKNILYQSKTATAMILVLSLLCVQCNKKEEGKLTVTTKPVTEITTESAKCGGNVSSTGNYTIGNCGVCWNTVPSPTVDNFFTTDNQGVGEFASIMSHLSSGTKYYVRAYATTSSGIMYGDELDFTTETPSAATLTVYTNDVTEITASTARCGGVVTANGNTPVTTRGVCWSTSPNPSIENNHTSDGQGLGAFSSIMSQLAGSTSYYVRAYATTESGVTYYGEEKTFRTESNGGGGGGNEGAVTVYTTEVSEITSTTAKCGGVVTANGEVIIIARGVCWSTSSEPSLAYHTTDGQGLGSFSSIITELDENTEYYVWAYATTESNMTYFGDKKVFNTVSQVTNSITIVTNSVSNITSTSAESGGDISCNGTCSITARGVCWNTTHNPEVSGAHTDDGQGIGTFISNMTGLSPNTTYFARAYAITDSEIKYGNEVSFNTLFEVPSEIEVIEITYNSVRIKISPAPNVAYYTAKIVGMGNAVQHNSTETELVFNNLSEQTEYTFEFSFYRSNGNLIDTDRISATTLEKPYEYAYVTVSLNSHTPVSLKLQFVPSANTSYYYLNIGETLTSTWQRTGTLTLNFDCLEPNTEYTFSVLAYDNNGVAGEVIHPKFTTDPAPYENYFNVGNNFYQLNTAQLSTEVLSNGYGQKVLTLRSSSVCWIRIMYLCSTSELNLNWSAGTFNIDNNSSYHHYNGMYSRTGTILNLPSGTFTISKSGSVYTIEMSVDNGYMRAHFSGVPTS